MTMDRASDAPVGAGQSFERRLMSFIETLSEDERHDFGRLLSAVATHAREPDDVAGFVSTVTTYTLVTMRALEKYLGWDINGNGVIGR